MFSSNHHSKVRSEITDEQLRLVAPSIFAGQAMQGVSSRYTFLPTAEVIGSMRQAGWATVHAVQASVLTIDTNSSACSRGLIQQLGDAGLTAHVQPPSYPKRCQSMIM